MSDSPTTERVLAALDPDDFEGYDEVWRDQRRRERDRTPPRNESLDNEPKPGPQIASGPFKLSSGGENKALFTEKLQFTYKIPIYPNTHPMGYAYVVPAQLIDDIDKLPLQLGLTIKAPHGKKQTRCPFLGHDVPCARYRYICQGIKMCRKARPELRNYSWTSLTIADWKQLEQWRSKVDLYEPNERLQRASGANGFVWDLGYKSEKEEAMCHGVHTHAPPPPNFVPTKWGEFAVSILSKIDGPNATTNDFVSCEALKSALNEVGLRTLAVGNPGILQGNRIENLIQFWKIDTYPCGPDLIEWEGTRVANRIAAEQNALNTPSAARDCVLTEGTRTEEVSDRRNLDSYHKCGIHHNQANRSNWNKDYIALRREVRNKRKREELEDRTQENLNQQGGESSAFSEADLEDMHSSGATRMPAGQPPAPRNPSPLVGQDQTVRPTVELQSSFQYPAGFTLPPSQGRDNNGRSLASRTLEQALMDGQLVEKQRLANEAERLRQAGEAQRQEFNQRLMNLREEFIRSILRRIEAGETEFDPRMFELC
ncbi:hypothetical protein E4U52_008291 [Claviceps spartinae]|nr:hypothetical protein E4U52_008291 [Claviceps spartinae]